MKKLLTVITTIFAIASVSTPTALAFSDVSETHNNYLSVEYLSQKGIVNGYEDGTFQPENLVNRAEALKIILEGNGVEVGEVTETIDFSDVKAGDWFARYIMTAKSQGIVNGNPDGTFAPGRDVARAEFLKMLLNSNSFKAEKWEGVQIFPDVPADAWFVAYMNYAGQAGLVNEDANGNLQPGKSLSRGEVAEIIYLLQVILNGSNPQFLITEAEKQMAQIDVYVNNNNPLAAKRASELSVDMTQQAYKSLPEDMNVLGAAKIARAYDFVINAYISALQENYEKAEDWANQASDKATEAWEINNALQPIAKHIKERAAEVVAQIPS